MLSEHCPQHAIHMLHIHLLTLEQMFEWFCCFHYAETSTFLQQGISISPIQTLLQSVGIVCITACFSEKSMWTHFVRNEKVSWCIVTCKENPLLHNFYSIVCTMIYPCIDNF